jgi:site-specific DNA recombinase
MSTATKKTRCAIYTRKSTEEGLEQEFNSLDAQREASEAYIKSQKHEGWESIPVAYDDGGYSGGNMDRPALAKLLADIEAGRVDIVVVYKVDRLSRALSDFARMVEIFDKHGVSFVSVTQSFNTTTSMGRLTLNVLLSFAQFEREVTGERIRDKIFASKKKGIWMGGPQPLGYDVVDRKLIVNEAEAAIIHFIFDYYVNKPNDQPLYLILDELQSRGYKNKSYTSMRGHEITGKDFTMAKIYNILSSPLYNGKTKHKHEIYEGEHAAIIDDVLWQQVQSSITKKAFVKHPNKSTERPKLVGKIADYHGNTLGPTYSYKHTATGRYKMRYYINREISKKGKTPSEFKRIRAEMIDNVVAAELSQLLEILIKGVSASGNAQLASVMLRQIQACVPEPIGLLHKIILYPKHMELTLGLDGAGEALSLSSLGEIEELLRAYDAKVAGSPKSGIFITLNIKAQYKRSGGQLFIVTENGRHVETSIDAEHQYPDDKSFTFIAKSFYWSKQMDLGAYKTIKDISMSGAHNFEYVKKSLNQRFLSPKIIEIITSKSTSSQIAVEQMIQCRHWCWEKQEQQLLAIT